MRVSRMITLAARTVSGLVGMISTNSGLVTDAQTVRESPLRRLPPSLYRFLEEVPEARTLFLEAVDEEGFDAAESRLRRVWANGQHTLVN